MVTSISTATKGQKMYYDEQEAYEKYCEAYGLDYSRGSSRGQPRRLLRLLMLLKPQLVSTRQFTYDTRNRRFIADMSSTHGFGRVYDDACDEGLTLISHRTGTEVVFVVWDEHRDEEGDLQYWTLRSVDGRWGMTLFND